MSALLSLTRLGLWVGQLVVAAVVGYLDLLATLAWLAPRRARAASAPAHRFLVLVPAHNEERLLPRLLASLAAMDFPRSMFEVHVVADNCSDGTASVAREAGAHVHERTDTSKAGKGFALQWLLGRIWDAGVAHDAVVILDADSVVSANFLSVMDAHLASGDRVVQAYYAVEDPGRTWSVGIRYAAIAAVHYLRPLARSVLGASVGLKGNGMVFAADVVRHYPWSASITEDIEYHLRLLLGGEKVAFAPDAVVWAEMPDTLASARSQNVRWERGRLETARLYVPRLVAQARARRSYAMLDAAVDQLIPPLSVVVGLSAALAGGAVVTSVWGRRRARRGACRIDPLVGLSAGVVGGEIAYVLSGLLLARAPGSVYRALLFAPVFAAWKLLVYARVLLGLDRQGWTRTARNVEGPR